MTTAKELSEEVKVIETTFSKKMKTGIQVVTVHLHQAFNIAGMTASSLYGKKNGFIMSLQPEGIYALTKDGAPFFVPASNVVAAII